VIVDEAGMAETRVLAPVLERIEAVGGKAVLIGDPQQLPAVGAGGLFAGIVERHGAIVLKENRRQHDEFERRALECVRAGTGRDYLAFAEQRDRLVVSEDPVTTKTRLLADWWTRAGNDLNGNVMLALRRRDVAELNALARGLMDSHGRLGRDRLRVSGHEFAAGDRIVCLRNSDRLGVKNGTRGTVKRVDREQRLITVSTDRGDLVELGCRYLEAGHVRHAYALTGHAGQGVTVDRAFVLGSGESRLQEWGYVALSRARDETRLYVTGNPMERESHFHELDDRDPVARLASALEESAVERLAVDQRPHDSGPHHATRAEIGRANLGGSSARQQRLIDQQRLVLRKHQERAKAELLKVEAEIDSLGVLSRRRGEALKIEARRLRTGIRLASEGVAELEGQAARLREHAVEAPRRAAPPRRGRPTDPQVPELGLDL
jgi:hypothetical protein